jgi:hypothetical protein
MILSTSKAGLSGLVDPMSSFKEDLTMLKLALAATLISAAALPAMAQGSDLSEPAPGISRSDNKFIGIDLDNRTVYYNGRNSGRYCIYKTQPVFNRYTGYYEYRRTRTCGRGLYL